MLCTKQECGERREKQYYRATKGGWVMRGRVEGNKRWRGEGGGGEREREQVSKHGA